MQEKILNKILIHIGFYKTGTSYLQKYLFYSKDQGFYCPWPMPSSKTVPYFIISNQAFREPAVIRKQFLNDLFAADFEGQMPIISLEGLSGNPFKGYYYEFEIAKKLYNVFPTAKIIIGIREQKSMIEALYRQYVHVGGMWSIEEYVGTGNEPFGYVPILRLEYLEYDLLINYYIQKFGKSNVLVLPLEMLKADIGYYFEMLQNFAGVRINYSNFMPVNVGNGHASIKIYRHFNKLIMKKPLNVKNEYKISNIYRMKKSIPYILDRIMPKFLQKYEKAKIQNYIFSRVGDYYKNSNNKLQNMVEFDLYSLGYDV